MKNRIQSSISNVYFKNNRGNWFIKKVLFLLAVLAFTSPSYRAMAQVSTHIDVVNFNLTSGCDWVVTVWNGGTIVDGPTTVAANSRYTNCISSSATQVDVIDAGATCTLISFVAPFTFTAVSPSCSPASCSPSIDCSGNSGILCTSPNTYIIVQIH